jgi:two-component sensor histidine kinase
MTAFDLFSFNQMRRNRDVLFFALNAFGWIAWGLGQYISFSLHGDPSMQQGGVPAMLAVAVATGFIATTGLRYLCRRLLRQSPWVMVLGAAFAAYLTALPMRVIINLAQQRYVEPDYVFQRWHELFMGVMWTSYLLVCWMGIYFAVHYYEAHMRERETSLRAMGLAQAAQMKMLRYQLNPHFLFNTLNAISTLVMDKQNDLANRVVTRLSNFLRYTLDQDPMKTTTLAQEVEALHLYLEIETMRFGSRLKVQIDVEPAAQLASVPSLLLQPVIENAIKYAISPREDGGSIRISGRMVGEARDSLELVICDDGPGMTDTARLDSGRGVGLRNTRERLHVMYGNNAQLLFTNANPGLSVTLRFPSHPIERGQSLAA